MRSEEICRQITCCTEAQGNFSAFTFSLVNGRAITNEEIVFIVPCPPKFRCIGPTITITIPAGNLRYTPVDFDPGDPPIVGEPWNPAPGTYDFTCGDQTLTVTTSGAFTPAQITQIINFLASCEATRQGISRLNPVPVGFTNEVVFLETECGANGALLVATGTLPYWMSLEDDDGQNILAARPGTFQGETQLAANAAALAALTNFATAAFTSGLLACKCFDNATPLPAAEVGVLYSVTLVASLGVPGTFSITSGSLPDGLTLDGETGELSGTPTVGDTFNFTATFTPS